MDAHWISHVHWRDNINGKLANNENKYEGLHFSVFLNRFCYIGKYAKMTYNNVTCKFYLLTNKF